MDQSATEYHHGQQNISEQRASYALFYGLAKWGSLAVGVLVLMLTLWFCANAGFFGGVIPGIALAVLGVIFLRAPATPDH